MQTKTLTLHVSLSFARIYTQQDTWGNRTYYATQVYRKDPFGRTQSVGSLSEDDWDEMRAQLHAKHRDYRAVSFDPSSSVLIFEDFTSIGD